MAARPDVFDRRFERIAAEGSFGLRQQVRRMRLAVSAPFVLTPPDDLRAPAGSVNPRKWHVQEDETTPRTAS